MLVNIVFLVVRETSSIDYSSVMTFFFFLSGVCFALLFLYFCHFCLVFVLFCFDALVGAL